jgi:chromosome segregation ATPase
MPQQSIEERLASLEKQSTERLASLEQEVKELKQELARRRTLEGLRADVQELQVRYQAHEEYVTERLNDLDAHVNTRLDVMEDHTTERFNAVDEQFNAVDKRLTTLTEGQQTLQAGQEQILAILTRQARTND